MHSSSSRAFQRHQEHDPITTKQNKLPSSSLRSFQRHQEHDLITKKQNKLPSVIDRLENWFWKKKLVGSQVHT
jgi:hypothetical protein